MTYYYSIARTQEVIKMFCYNSKLMPGGHGWNIDKLIAREPLFQAHNCYIAAVLTCTLQQMQHQSTC